MKLQQKPDGYYFLNLPKKLVEAKSWKKGQEFEVRFNERGNIELEEAK